MFLTKRAAPSAGASGQGAFRRGNLTSVLRLLCDLGPRSRAEIATATGLTKATVTALVSDLIERGLVVERELTYTGMSGRPSRPLELSGQRVAGIGLELEPDGWAGVLADLTGTPLIERHLDRSGPPPNGNGASADLLAFVCGLLDEAKQRSLLVGGLCISMPSPVDHRLRPAAEGGWCPSEVFPLVAAEVSDRFGRVPELSLEHESNLVALAEARTGGHGAAANLLCVVGRNGVSAGAVVDGNLGHGAAGYLGGVGHLVVDPNGNHCRCGGRGCWETVVGLDAILRDAAPDLLGPCTGQARSRRLALLVERASAGDERVLDGLAHAGRWLGVGLASLINVLNPETVVLCGYIGDLAPWTLDTALRTVDRHCVGPARSDSTIATSTLGPSAAALGAAISGCWGVLYDPLSVPKD